MSQHPAAVAAVAELHRLSAAGTMDVEPPELMRLADEAVSGFDLDKDRREIADMLIEALTVVRFAPVFGHDAEPARRRITAILDAIVKSTLA